MRIAIFHELPKKSGSRKAVDQIAALLAKNHKVELYYTDAIRSYSGTPYKTHFYKFIPVKWSGGNPGKRIYRDTVELVKLFFLHRKIAGDIRKKNYDVLFVHGSYLTESPLILLFKNTLKMYYAHAPNYTLVFEKVMGMPKPDRIRYVYEIVNRSMRKILDKANVRSADVILANSAYTKNKISSFYNRKSYVSYLGVDTSIYKPRQIKKKYDVLFVGSHHPVDGYNLLHQAFSVMRRKPVLKVLAIEDEWIESDMEMSKLYNESKIVLCLAHGEPFGLVAIEAMACGIPVIAVDEAGYRETVIHNSTGLLIKRSPKELSEAIRKLLRQEKKLQQYSVNSRALALRNWSWKVSVRSLEKIIERRVKNA